MKFSTINESLVKLAGSLDYPTDDVLVDVCLDKERVTFYRFKSVSCKLVSTISVDFSDFPAIVNVETVDDYFNFVNANLADIVQKGGISHRFVYMPYDNRYEGVGYVQYDLNFGGYS